MDDSWQKIAGRIQDGAAVTWEQLGDWLMDANFFVDSPLRVYWTDVASGVAGDSGKEPK